MRSSNPQPVVFSDNVLSSIRAVWQHIGSDCESVCEEVGESLTNEMAIESCIDANRMTTNCGANGKAADEEVAKLIDTHGYSKVMRALKQKVRLA